jgi:very-short-patch-repair endonuclease
MSTAEGSVPSIPLQSSDEARIAASLDNWKRKLLDLSKRNRALNFRMTKVSTVAVVDEQPAEVFRRLYLAEKPVRFRAAIEEPPAPPSPSPEAAQSDATASSSVDEPQPTPPVITVSDQAQTVIADTAIGGSASTDEAVSETGAIDGSASTSDAVSQAESADGAASAETALEMRSVDGSPSAEGAVSQTQASGGSASIEAVAAVDGTASAVDAVYEVGADAATGGSGFDALEEDAPAADAFAPYEAAGLHERHRDDTLQTTAAPELLDRSLRRIDEQARETVEEQGVNALFLALGMLHYREKGADDVFRAPLVLLPVRLARKSAAAGYTLHATDDDPIVNPALAEYLRREHAIVLPDLPDPSTIADDYDLQHFLSAATDAVAKQEGWKVTTEIYLGLFAFQKFVMYKDLEANGGAFGAHRLIRQLVTRTGESIVGLPDEVRAARLDDVFPPESSAQVVDADSSQLRAIVAVSLGHDLVLEGPPGTGKSQTITNLIAQALAAGQSVLFVAEKMAALSVVHERLVRAGLGDFCLELHSTKANKRAVVKEIARSLDASLRKPKPGENAAARLPGVRGALTAYAEAVHAPFGAAGFAPYRGFGELQTLRDAKRLKLETPIDAVTREQFEDAVRSLEELARAVEGVGEPGRHPWRGSTRTLWTEDELDDARELLDALRPALAEAAALGAELSAALGLPPVRTLGDARTALHVSEVMRRSPGAPLAVLRSDAWNAPPREAQELVEHGRRIASLRAHVSQRFKDEALRHDHANDVTFVLEKEGSFFSFLNGLNGRFREIQDRWTSYRLPAAASMSLVEQAQEMKRVDELRRERAWLEGRDAVGRNLFGALWFGEASDWDALEGYVRWVVEFRGLAVLHRLDEKAAQVAASPTPDVAVATRFQDAAERAAGALTLLRQLAGFPADWLAAAPLDEIAARAKELHDGAAQAPRWAAFEMVRQKAAASLAGEVVAPAMAGEVAFAELPRAFRRAFHQKWVTAAVQERPALREFATMTHEQRVEEFRRLDAAVLRENRDALVARLRDEVQAKLRMPEAKAAMPFLQREMARERRHAPLRRTLQQSGVAIRAIKPCFMMSPLSVAQLLDGGAGPSFDLVIFDEASQLPSEDAVGAIVRGARLVVVGDPKQLPPTNFFSVMAGQEAAPLADDGTPLFEDTESVLEEFLGAGVPKTRLRWHYRSTHESLITFSNVSFYEADLHTFPSVETESHAEGLVFRFVEGGVYEGKGLNLVEARQVVDEVVRHAKENPDLSLGVGTFNLRQQVAIQDELEARRRADPTLERFFSRDRPEPFFVKNLENIQGDERDVILLSVTYAKGHDGRLRKNFGPINGENGWRRLNVLTTRARRKMIVFSSMRGDEIDVTDAAQRGPALMRDFLLYAERGHLAGMKPTEAAEAESVFEREVAAELTRRGLRIQPQVGVAGYRIDMAVLDDEVRGRYVCGIECDGVSYHASETARDRDRLRQQVLEDRGWEIHRVWSVDWFKDREGQIERLLSLVEASRLRTRETAAAEQAAAEAASDAVTSPQPADSGDSVDAVDSVDAPPSTESVAPPPEPVAEPIAAPVADPAEDAPPVAETPAEPAPSAPLGAQPYRKADTAPRHAGTDILTAPPALLLAAIEEIVAAEAPLHVADLVERVTEMWGLTRAGTRVMGRLEYALKMAEQQEILALRGDFVWPPSGAFAVRSRAGTGIPAERIPPEEYREAAVMVLRATGAVPRKELTNRVRALMGFSRTGPRLEEAIGAALESLLADGSAGEASAGIKLRE